jgi:hypothetical protein
MWRCQKCDEVNEDSFEACRSCGASKTRDEAPTPRELDDPQFAEISWASDKRGKQSTNVPTHLVEAILVTLLCCAPFGVVAIVYAAQVKPKLDAGDYYGALRASKSARTWTVAALGLGRSSGRPRAPWPRRVRHKRRQPGLTYRTGRPTTNFQGFARCISSLDMRDWLTLRGLWSRACLSPSRQTVVGSARG